MNNQNQQQQNNDDPMKNLNTQYGASGGSPEAPTPISGNESAPDQGSEFGYERLKQLEQSAETALEAAERKESNKVDDPKQRRPQQPQHKKKNPVRKVPNTNAPKYFGYNISPQIANNPQIVKSRAGKGDPKNSQTWVYVLLERLLKMRSRK